MREKKLFKIIFGFSPVTGEESECTFEVSNDLLKISCRGMERTMIIEDDYHVCDLESGEYLFMTEELNNLYGFQKFNECPDCDGTGYREMFVSCYKPASECCGGCTEWTECECENKPIKYV